MRDESSLKLFDLLPSQSVRITSNELIQSRICGFVKVERLIGNSFFDIFFTLGKF